MTGCGEPAASKSPASRTGPIRSPRPKSNTPWATRRRTANTRPRSKSCRATRCGLPSSAATRVTRLSRVTETRRRGTRSTGVATTTKTTNSSATGSSGSWSGTRSFSSIPTRSRGSTTQALTLTIGSTSVSLTPNGLNLTCGGATVQITPDSIKFNAGRIDLN